MDMSFKACNTHANRVVSNFRLRGPTKQKKKFSGHVMCYLVTINNNTLSTTVPILG